MKISEKIKELRKNFGLNQEELARYLEVDQTLISRIESDERNATLGMLRRLSELFACPLESLLDENMMPEVIKVPFRSKDATPNDLCTLSKANKIILNLKEMLDLKEK